MIEEFEDEYILGLDISTTTAGWALLSFRSNSLKMGYIPLDDFENLYDKAQEFEKKIAPVLKNHKIIKVFIEEDLKKFRPGMSSASTIQKLSRFNGMASLIIFQLRGSYPEHLNVSVARKSVGCKVNKELEETTKDQVFNWVKERSDSYEWPSKVILRGKDKGIQRFIKECYDMSDAYIIGLAGKKILEK